MKAAALALALAACAPAPFTGRAQPRWPYDDARARRLEHEPGRFWETDGAAKARTPDARPLARPGDRRSVEGPPRHRPPRLEAEEGGDFWKGIR